MARTMALAALALGLLAGLAGSGAAAPIGVGIGAYGGLSFPIVQDDVGNGALFGLRVPVRILPMITLEPYWLSAKMDDGEEEIGGITYTRDGFDHTGIGVNAMLGSMGAGPGFRFYPYVGIGSHKLEREGTPEIKETAYNVGLGLGLTPTPKVSLHVRGELNMVVTGDTSRKFANATVGLNYDLLP